MTDSFLHRMRRSYVDGFMCQRKHLLISREHFSILICRSQTGTFVFCGNAFSESLEKDFLQSEGFTMLKVMQVVSSQCRCVIAKWMLMIPSCPMLRVAFS